MEFLKGFSEQHQLIFNYPLYNQRPSHGYKIEFNPKTHVLDSLDDKFDCKSIHSISDFLKDQRQKQYWLHLDLQNIILYTIVKWYLLIIQSNLMINNFINLMVFVKIN